MIREVCLYDKFSFCKNGVKCMKVHLKEVCQNRECDYRMCNKRHPRPCRIFRMYGFCRFGTSCRYSHRLPKEVEEQNQKIESIEKINAKLSKQIDDQNEEIKKLKSKLLEIESRELKNLQIQINNLVKKNNEKEIAIRKINSGETNEEEEVELDERADSCIEFQDDKENNEIEKESLEFLKKNWNILSELEIKLSKRTKAFGKLLRSYNCKIIEEQGSVQWTEMRAESWLSCRDEMARIDSFLDIETEMSKEAILNLVKETKVGLRETLMSHFKQEVDLKNEFLV